MRQVRLNIDDKLYWRIKKTGYSYNELLALGIRLKQIFDIFEGKLEKDADICFETPKMPDSEPELVK